MPPHRTHKITSTRWANPVGCQGDLAVLLKKALGASGLDKAGDGRSEVAQFLALGA